MKLVIRQFNVKLATIDRNDNTPEVTDADLTALAPTVERLKAEGKLKTGYYDVLLFDKGTDIDGSIEIA